MRVRRIVPRNETSRLRFVDSIVGRGRDLYRLACEHDTEGVVAKWRRGCYHADGTTTSWLKIKNPAYTQVVGRHELFQGRSASRSIRKPYRLDPAARIA